MRPIFILIFVTFVSKLLFQYSPEFLELFYFNFIFRIQRLLYDYSFGFLPFPAVYLLLIILMLWIIFSYREGIRWQKLGLWSTVRSIFSFLAIVLCLFYWNWGFNYLRPNFYEKWQVEKATIDLDHLSSKISQLSETMLIIKDEAQHSRNAQELESEIRKQLEKTIIQLDDQAFSRPRVRRLDPPGILLRFSTAGIYLPFVFEGHIDAGLHPIQKPFTMAHEMAHAYGYTDEGECNFLAYLTTQKSADQDIQYSGQMAYLRYLLVDVRRNYPDHYTKIRDKIPSQILKDIRSIQEQMKKYPDLMPKLRDLVYDQYLIANGISDGLKSYSAIINLVATYEELESIPVNNHSDFE